MWDLGGMTRSVGVEHRDTLLLFILIEVEA